VQLRSYHWPGNIRELRNVVEQCCARARGATVIELNHLPRVLTTRPTAGRSGDFPSTRVFDEGEFAAPGVVHVASSQALSNAPATANDVPLLPLHQVEREHIERALRVCGGNKTHAAQMLGLSRHQLYLRLERFGLNFGGDKSSRQVR
jgi:DNA-binding NtrC family response regulator